MQDETIRKPGRFEWRRSGNQYVCNFGKLYASVKKRGRKGIDLRWRVDSVFGNPFLGQGDWHGDVDTVILEAEEIAIREAALLQVHMREAFVAGLGKVRPPRRRAGRSRVRT